jgi:integrase
MRVRANLTDRVCANLKATTQEDHFDAAVPGLALRVGPRSKSWTLHLKGKRHTLGSYPAMSLADARGIAREFRLTGATQIKVVVNTLREVAERYLASDGAKLRSAKERRAIFERHVFPALGSRPISEIKRSDVIRMLDALQGDRIHDLVLAILSKLFNWWAIRDEDFKSPIIRGMAKGSKSRDRMLSDEELRAVWIATVDSHYGAYVRLLLLTACRRNEVRDMVRGELSADGTEWLIPARRTKQAKDHLVPLSKAAQGIIASLPPVDRLDPGHRLFLNGVVRFGHQPQKRLLADSGTSGWTLHDLRRTARSLMSRVGVPSDHAERCLGHVIGGVRGVYDRHAYVEEKRAAFEALAMEIGKITGHPVLC